MSKELERALRLCDAEGIAKHLVNSNEPYSVIAWINDKSIDLSVEVYSKTTILVDILPSMLGVLKDAGILVYTKDCRTQVGNDA